MWTTLIFMFLAVHQAIYGHGSENKRHKRYLLFTPNTQWGVFATVSVPLHPETTTSVAWFFEANYYNVANASYFEPLLGDIVTTGRKEKRSASQEVLTRRRLYAFIESLLEQYGYPGQSCLFRAICENATTHFFHNGVLGDLIHLILTPSTSLSEDDLEDCYYEAEYLGLEGDCEQYEYECPTNPLEFVSIHAERFN